MSSILRPILWLIILVSLIIYLAPRAARILFPFPYRETIIQFARQESLDPLLITAVIKVESKFNPRAESTEGARGLMQLMPETARLAAGQLNLPFEPDRLFIPEYNLRLGSWYLASLVEEFGDLVPALAAYNGGRGNVHRWLDSGSWDGTRENLKGIPFPETREFVRNVITNYRVYRFLYTDVHKQVFGT